MKGVAGVKPGLARFASISGIILCGLGLFAGLAQSQSSASSGFRIFLTGGKLHGFQWGLAATGSKERPMRKICAGLSEVAPPQPGTEFVETSETSSCGSLREVTDSITLSSEFGTDESGKILLRTSLYPNDVHRVTFVLAGGEEVTYRAKGIEVKNRKAKGIPFFRYLAAQFSAEACIQRIVSYDGRGRVIKREKGDKICPQGA
jgi:hypothetical protein